MNLELGLNILLVLLLLPTVVYVALLQRRLSSLRADREAVETVIDRMNEATRRAEASLKGIRQAAEQAKVTLDEPVSVAPPGRHRPSRCPAPKPTRSARKPSAIS